MDEPKKIPESALAGHQVEFFFANIEREILRQKTEHPKATNFYKDMENTLLTQMRAEHKKNGFLTLDDVNNAMDLFCINSIRKTDYKQHIKSALEEVAKLLKDWLERSFKEINRNVPRERPPGLDRGGNGIGGNGHGGNGRGGI